MHNKVAAFNSNAFMIVTETLSTRTWIRIRFPIIIILVILKVGDKGGATEVSGLQAWCWEKAVDDRDVCKRM